MKHTIFLCFLATLLIMPMSASADGVLIFGGTGNTGSRIAKHLAEKGQDVAVFVRPTSNRTRLDGYDVQFVVGDVTDEATVIAAYETVKPEAVVAVMQSRRGQPSPHGKPEVRLVELAERFNVEQFVYLSSRAAGPDTPARRVQFQDTNFDLFAEGLRLKGLVEDALRAGKVPYTIMRTGSMLVEFGREPPPGTGRAYLTSVNDTTAIAAVTYDDLAILMARCVGNMACHGKTYLAADDTLGPEYNHWRCRRFAVTGDLDAECDHLRPIDGFPVQPRK